MRMLAIAAPLGTAVIGGGCAHAETLAFRDISGYTPVRVRTMAGQKQSNDPTRGNPIQGRPIKTLAPQHSITVDAAVCGVNDDKTTVCKDPLCSGFVLSPNGSGWLPHV